MLLELASTEVVAAVHHGLDHRQSGRPFVHHHPVAEPDDVEPERFEEGVPYPVPVYATSGFSVTQTEVLLCAIQFKSEAISDNKIDPSLSEYRHLQFAADSSSC